MEIKKLCKQYGLEPSKRYGQHYLVSDAPIKRMIEAAALRPTDTVIEIGPGFGMLTLAVAPLVKEVIAFEIERKLEPYWEEKMQEYPNVRIVWGNALTQLLPLLGKDGPLRPEEEAGLPAEALAQAGVVDAVEDEVVREPSHGSTTPPAFGLGAPPFQGGESYKVLANLPYGITSDTLRLFLEAEQKPEKIVVMVQKEVGERMTAKPGDMSLLSVAVQYYGEPNIVAKVPPGAFWPPPRVESVVVAVDVHENTESTENTKTLDDEAFFRVVRTGFSHKRKQLWTNLANGFHLPPELVKEVLKQIVHNEKIRAEELSVEDWKQIAERLKP